LNKRGVTGLLEFSEQGEGRLEEVEPRKWQKKKRPVKVGGKTPTIGKGRRKRKG